jgi:hypothetical protein
VIVVIVVVGAVVRFTALKDHMGILQVFIVIKGRMVIKGIIVIRICGVVVVVVCGDTDHGHRSGAPVFFYFFMEARIPSFIEYDDTRIFSK